MIGGRRRIDALDFFIFIGIISHKLHTIFQSPNGDWKMYFILFDTKLYFYAVYTKKCTHQMFLIFVNTDNENEIM